MIKICRFFIIELTLNCNTICDYCYLGHDRRPYDNMLMTYDMFKNTIDNITYIVAFENKHNVHVILHGGEPLLLGYDTIEKLVTYMITKFNEYNVRDNIHISIQTNGILLDDKYKKLFNKNNIDIGVSFDYNNTYRIKNEYINTSISDKVNNGVGVISVLNKDNISIVSKNIDEQKSFIKPIILDDINDTNISPNINDIVELHTKLFINSINRGKFSNPELLKSIHYERFFMRALLDILFINENVVSTTCMDQFCGTGVNIIAIMPNGNIRICDRWRPNRDDMALINVDVNFLGINQIKKTFNIYLEYDKVYRQNHCDFCPERRACVSTCQSLYYSKNNKFGINPDKCSYTKKVYKYINDNIIEILKLLMCGEKVKTIYFNELVLSKLRDNINNILRKYGLMIKLINEHSFKIICLEEDENEKY